MSSAVFNMSSVRTFMEKDKWHSRVFSPYAIDVIETYKNVHYVAEYTSMNREDYEVESYECVGDLFVFYYSGDGYTECNPGSAFRTDGDTLCDPGSAFRTDGDTLCDPGSAFRTDELVVDYYSLEEEFYERIYSNLPPERLSPRLFQKLKAALKA